MRANCLRALPAHSMPRKHRNWCRTKHTRKSRICASLACAAPVRMRAPPLATGKTRSRRPKTNPSAPPPAHLHGRVALQLLLARRLPGLGPLAVGPQALVHHVAGRAHVAHLLLQPLRVAVVVRLGAGVALRRA